jgi:predicted  nucleic acid-binding Zn-ribbon protein
MSDKIDKAFDDLMSAEHMTGGASQVLAEHMNDLQDEIERLTAEIERKDVEISNLRLANDEARKTIDRLCEQIPREALSAGEGRDDA